MKAKGIVRQLDSLGRIVIPIEMRRRLDIAEHDGVEIIADGDTIVLKKHQESCIFCGRTTGIIDCWGKKVCASCAKEIGKLV